MSRNESREAILKQKPKSEVIDFFGQKVEIRQPSMAVMFARDSSEDGTPIPASIKSAKMLIAYAYDAETGEKLFEDSDAEEIAKLPWGEDLMRAQAAIGRLSGVDEKAVQEAIKNLELTQG